MITLNHHPSLQRLLDEWKSSLRASSSRKGPACTADDLQRLIRKLEDEYDAIAERLDSQHQIPFKELFKLNCLWLRDRLEAGISTLRRIMREPKK